MRYVEVDRQGKFKVKGDLRVLYSVMIFIRVQLIGAASYHLSMGLTIATRYAVLRRQFSTLDG